MSYEMFPENLLTDIEKNIILRSLPKKVLTSVHKICLILFVLPNMLEFKNDSIQQFLLTHQAFKNFFSGELLHETTFFYNYLRNGDALYRWPL